MLFGLPVLAAVGAVAAGGLSLAGATDDSLRMLFACITTGALGAIVSVLSRMTLGTLSLEFESGHHVLRLLGGVRPFVGAIFGVAMYLILSSGLLPIELPSDTSERSAFLAAVAFLAGFSERWAQDMLVASQGAASAALERDPIGSSEQADHA
jgi:hypothetical protein